VGPGRVDDRLEVMCERLSVLPTHAVVSSQLEHEHIYGIGDHPRDAAQPTCAGFTAHPSVHDARGDGGGVGHRLEPRREGFFGGAESEPRGQARAHEDHSGTCFPRRALVAVWVRWVSRCGGGCLLR